MKKKPATSAPLCLFCKRSNDVQFVIFSPRFKPFGTACTECEASATPQQIAEAAPLLDPALNKAEIERATAHSPQTPTTPSKRNINIITT